jgi:copper chaperone CopZ
MSTTTHYAIQNMKCGGCVAAVTETVEKLPGVEAVQVSLEEASGTVTGNVDPQQVAEAITAAGYPASVKQD